MKKIFLLGMAVFAMQTAYTQNGTVTYQQVEEYTVDLSPDANHGNIKKLGKYPGLISFKNNVLRNDAWTPDSRYQIIYPASGCEVTHINMDLRSKYNSRFHGGGFLDPGKKEHWLIKVVATGEVAPLGCLNFGSITTYRISDCSTEPSTYVLRQQPSVSTTTLFEEEPDRVEPDLQRRRVVQAPKELRQPKSIVIREATSRTDYGANTTYAANTGYQDRSQPQYSECYLFWREKYPAQFARFEQTKRRKEFRSVPAYDRNEIKKCIYGKGRFARNLAVIIPSGAALLTTAGILILNSAKATVVTEDDMPPAGPIPGNTPAGN